VTLAFTLSVAYIKH